MPLSLSSSLHKTFACAAWGEDLCQSTFIDKWKPSALSLGGTFWLQEHLDEDIWASIVAHPSLSCPRSDPSSNPWPAACNQDQGSLWLLLAVELGALDGEIWGWSPRGNLALCGNRDQQVAKAAGAPSCHASTKEPHRGAVAWHGEGQYQELLATRMGRKKRCPSSQNGACCNCLQSWLTQWWGM